MDLIGKKIHELTILDRYRKDNRVYYKVKCSCGKIFETRRDSITSGRTKSCGHLTQFENKDLAGDKFGRLTVIKKLNINKEGRQQWLCKCGCGNEIITNTNLLTSGRTKSCGCIRREMGTENKYRLYEFLEKDRVENTSLEAISRESPIFTNTSGVTGVTWDKSRGKWLAQIVFQGKKIFLGRFDKKEDAIEARKAAEEKYFKPIIDKYKD